MWWKVDLDSVESKGQGNRGIFLPQLNAANPTQPSGRVGEVNPQIKKIFAD